MRERVIGYWTLAWIGLISNIIALPIITLITIFIPPYRAANITLASSLGWPAAIVGIISSSALLAEKKMGSYFDISFPFNGNCWNDTIFNC